LDLEAAKAKRKRPDLIRTENEEPGTADWMLSNTAFAPVTKYPMSVD
jgi:hypothetical protein